MENFFCRIKRFRRIATRHDQTESSYAALIFVAATMLALEWTVHALQPVGWNS